MKSLIELAESFNLCGPVIKQSYAIQTLYQAYKSSRRDSEEDCLVETESYSRHAPSLSVCDEPGTNCDCNDCPSDCLCTSDDCDND